MESSDYEERQAYGYDIVFEIAAAQQVNANDVCRMNYARNAISRPVRVPK